MPSTIETGHAKIVANFESMISFCTAYGSGYNPSNTALQVSSLNANLKAAQTIMADVKTAEVSYNNAVNERKIAFTPLKSLATKLVNALQAANASNEMVKDAQSILRKIRGQRATPKEKPAAPANPAVPANTAPVAKTISASQQSYDQQVEFFAKLIELLSSDGNYKPNEKELQVATLTAMLPNLKSANSAVINAYTDWSNARISRDEALYNPLTGLRALAMSVKKYVKSIYGTTSAQFKQVSGLKFS